MNLWKTLASLCASALFVLLAAGSASEPAVYDTTNWAPVKVPGGVVANRDLKIVAEDGSFTLEGGKRFTTPFDIYGWKNSTAFASDDKLLENYNNALANGARKVRIYQQGLSEPLYGVLLFNQGIASAHGPGARSYMVQVPEDKLAAARNGVTSVAFERMYWTASWSSGSKSEKHWYGWALWISAYPF
ncbi:hypothetical protein [Gallaecimonas xiamenensis]|uniref:Uncharacterized protein n=1 Tax=Gallaecimonas xiamenensis 3-C-1 TaxID=745411 RepID=K2JSC1_9GAMM|nr:hypothetical protein [Gallaecimonas xiamenensis]EKE77407.1 hypothetical protein B3C1_01310 [Gallaecimonas xiamenensis 3-C-1]